MGGTRVEFIIGSGCWKVLIMDLIGGHLLTGEEDIRVEAENGSGETRETAGGAAQEGGVEEGGGACSPETQA